MKTTLSLGLAMLSLAPVALPATSQAAPKARYTIMDLGTLGGEFSMANAINARGEIAGQSTSKDGQLRAVKWVRGKIVDCGVGDGSSNALDINDRGEMVGYTGKTFGINSRSVKWGADGKATTFSMPDGWKEGGNALRSINNRGQMVGYASDTAEGEVEGDAQGFFYSPDKDAIAPLKGDEVNIIPFGLNEAGEAVMTVSFEGKQRAWKYPTKMPMEIDEDVQLADINDRGEVAACLNGNQAIQIKTTGNAIGITQFGAGLPTKINNKGQMIGIGEHGAALFENRAAIDLNTLIAPGSGWVLTNANGINDAGQIVGFGKFKGSDIRAFLLTPKK